MNQMSAKYIYLLVSVLAITQIKPGEHSGLSPLLCVRTKTFQIRSRRTLSVRINQR